MMVTMNVLNVVIQTRCEMRKADKVLFYRCVDEMKFIIQSNKVLSQKDIGIIENEMLTIKYLLKEKYKNV